MFSQTSVLFAIAGLGSLAALVLSWRWKLIHPKAFGTKASALRDVWGVEAPVWFVAAALTFLAMPVFFNMAMQLPETLMGAPKSAQREAAGLALAQVGGCVVGVLVVLVLRTRLSSKSGLQARPADVLHGCVGMLMAAPVCLLAGILASMVSEWTQGSPPDKIAHEALKAMMDDRGTGVFVVRVVSAVVLAPVFEEILYRALLQSCMLRMFERTWPAIIATSTIFCSAHVIGGGPVNVWALPMLFVLSMALGTAFERQRSLGVPIVMHALFNGANIALALWQSGPGAGTGAGSAV